MQASNAHMQSVLVYSVFVQGSFGLIDGRIYVAFSSHVNRIPSSGAFDSTIQDMFERKFTFLKWSLAGLLKSTEVVFFWRRRSFAEQRRTPRLVWINKIELKSRNGSQGQRKNWNAFILKQATETNIYCERKWRIAELMLATHDDKFKDEKFVFRFPSALFAHRFSENIKIQLKTAAEPIDAWAWWICRRFCTRAPMNTLCRYANTRSRSMNANIRVCAHQSKEGAVLWWCEWFIHLQERDI